MGRKTTIELLEMCLSGALSWQRVVEACLEYMSEYQVNDMATDEGFIEEDEEDDDVDIPDIDLDDVDEDIDVSVLEGDDL